MKENITRFLAPCRTCGEPTPNFDGYCDACEPVEQVEQHPFQPAYKDYHAPDQTK